MTKALSNDLDYLATRFHARRSRMAEAGRLDELCRLHSMPELGRAIFPGSEFSTTADFQRRLVQDWMQELTGCLKHLDASRHEFVAWLLVRLQVENAKVLLRSFLNHAPLESMRPHLLALPPDWAPNATELMAARSVEEFIFLLPPGRPRQRLRAAVAGQRELPPFFFEAALDAGYFEELLARTNRLPGDDLEIVKPMILQEANIFQLMLVVRGRFHFGLAAESLLTLRVLACAGNEWFKALLSAPDILSAAKCVVGVVIDALPAGPPGGGAPGTVEISNLEALAWQRYLRLANNAFRRSHLGVAAVAGYFGFRRIEIANLITLSECIRLGVGERESRGRMIPRLDLEVAHV